MSDDRTIPDAKTLRKMAEPKPRPPVEVRHEEVEIRIQELRGDVAHFLKETAQNPLSRHQPHAINMRVGVARSYPGNNMPARLEDFGADYQAALKLREELRQKGYTATLTIQENSRIGPMVEDDCLYLNISW